MNVDWAVAVSVFLVFVGIGFAYYWGLFEDRPDSIGISLDDANRKVLDFLTVDSWKVPVRYNSSSAGIAVMYFDFQWPQGTKNSARMLDSSLPLSCMFQGDRLYFQADVQNGNNDFELTFANISSSMLCNSALDTSSSYPAVPWVSEKTRLVSQSRIDQMLGTDYSQFRQSLEILRNFRVEAGTSSYGPSAPAYTNTYVKETHSLIQETGNPISVRVMVW